MRNCFIKPSSLSNRLLVFTAGINAHHRPMPSRCMRKLRAWCNPSIARSFGSRYLYGLGMRYNAVALPLKYPIQLAKCTKAAGNPFRPVRSDYTARDTPRPYHRPNEFLAIVFLCPVHYDPVLRPLFQTLP
jgi:hypothetical protein